MTAPLIETARLRLRPHDIGDYDAVHALWSEPQVFRHITGKPATREEAWGRLLRYVGHWQLMGFGYWAIEDKAGDFIGEAGFANFRRDMEPSFGDTPEMGWVLSSRHHRKGYGSEALTAILQWAKANLASDRAACMIAPENEASLALARKMGFIDHGLARYHGDIALLLELKLRP